MEQRFSIACPGLLLVVLIVTTGCQTLNPWSSSGGKKKGPFGLKRDKPLIDDSEYLDPMGRRSLNRLVLQDLAPSQLPTTLATRVSTKADPEAAQQALAEGRRLYEQALAQMTETPDGTGHLDLFTKAANQFRMAASKLPDSDLEEEALFYQGESFFFANRYVQANRALENLIVKYAGTRYLDKAEARRFAIAQYWLGLAESDSAIKWNDPARPLAGLKGEARRILHRIRLDDPTGKLADDATLALGNAYFQAERWVDAADAYEDLRMNYPGSSHQFPAHLFELKARMNAYRGASYDSEPLEKADKLLKQLIRSFPEQAQAEEAYLAKEGALIRHALAERDWDMAKYFARRGENRAALIYYQRVAQQYSDTQFASLAQQEVQRLSELPPEPTQPAEWLVNLFPDPKSAKPLVATRPTAKTLR